MFYYKIPAFDEKEGPLLVPDREIALEVRDEIRIGYGKRRPGR
jgi:hypothetical protein